MNDSKKDLYNDILEWDVDNWGRAIEYWDSILGDCDFKDKRILDIGGRGGGLSLYWALKGGIVTYSDLNDDYIEQARTLHRKYGVEDQVVYKVLDVTKLDEKASYDIISFKSVLGGVGSYNNVSAQETMLNNIYNALKNGGRLVFVENLPASRLHQLFRKIFRNWGSRWKYTSIDDVIKMCSMFSEYSYETFGYFAPFGVGPLKIVFSKIDEKIERLVKREKRYIFSGVFTK